MNKAMIYIQITASELEFTANLKAFCQMAVDRLGYENISRVLDVLDENFDVVQDWALDCCFDQGLAWAILQGETE